MKKHLRSSLLLAALAMSGQSYEAIAQNMAGGLQHSAYLCSNGTAMSTGFNAYGELGDGTFTSRQSLAEVNGLNGVIAVSSGQSHTLFLRNDGTVWAVGKNGYGELGDGTTINRSLPVQVTGMNNVVKIAAGYNNSLFLKADGTVWICGSNFAGQLGLGFADATAHTVPVQIEQINDVIAMAAGSEFILLVKGDGSAWSCGKNNAGVLGDGSVLDKASLVQVQGISDVKAVAGGTGFALFLKNNGTVWGTGGNNHGQLGNGAGVVFDVNPTAVQVAGIANVTAIAAGAFHSVMLKNDGTVWTTGHNTYGQLADATTTARAIPAQIAGLAGVSSVNAAWWSTMVQKNDGTFWSAGRNDFGQLGDGSAIDRTIPIQITVSCLPSAAGEELQQADGVTVYPNPGNGRFRFVADNGEYKADLSIRNLLGEEVYKASVITGAEIDISRQPAGVYFYGLRNSHSQNITGKLIIE